MRGHSKPPLARAMGVTACAAAGLLAAAALGAKTTVPIATRMPYSVRVYNTDAWTKTGELRFTPSGQTPGGSGDIVQAFTIRGYNTQEFTFPSAAGQLVQTPDNDTVTGEPYPDLAMDIETTDNGKIQSPVTLEDLTNTKPLVGARGSELLVSAGPSGMQFLAYAFSPSGIGSQATQTIASNSTSYFTLDQLVGTGSDPIAVEILSGSGVAVVQDACNNEYRRLTVTDVSPRVANAVAGWLADPKGTYSFSKSEMSALVPDPAFVHILFDASAQGALGNETTLQNFLSLGYDGVTNNTSFEFADWAMKINGKLGKIKLRGSPGKAIYKWNKVSVPPYVVFGPSADKTREQAMLEYLQDKMPLIVQQNLAAYSSYLENGTNPWK